MNRNEDIQNGDVYEGNPKHCIAVVGAHLGIDDGLAWEKIATAWPLSSLSDEIDSPIEGTFTLFWTE